MNASIFISYRRADTGGHAGRLHDRLMQWFDADALFYDLDSIDSGQVFPARLEQAVNAASVVLVLIGPDWLTELNRRAALAETDFVRREIELALQRHAAGGEPTIIPVLLGGATPPVQGALHASLLTTLAPLCSFDVHTFQGKNADWTHQFVRLRELIAAVPGVPAPRFRPPAGTLRPFRVIEHLLSAHFQDPNGLVARLRATLQASGSAAVLARAALYGMGGVGKTQLALKYSYEYRNDYAGVWWFRAETEATLQIDAGDCCRAACAPLEDGEVPSNALKRWLATQQAPWLLVFDNVGDVASVRLHMPDVKNHHVIITSRNPALVGIAQPIELDVWSREQGADFLAARLPTEPRTDLVALAEDLGGLPLALEQAASYLDETGGTVALYRSLLAATDTADLTLDEGRAATGYERTVAATLSLAFHRLSGAAARLLRLCAFAAPEPLPERFFVEARNLLPTELYEATANGLAWDKVAGELRRFGLAERVEIAGLDPASRDGSGSTELALSLHRLTQQVTRARLAAPRDDGPVFEAMLDLCCLADPYLPEHRPRFAAMAPHAMQLDRFTEAGWHDMRRFVSLLDRAARYLRFGPALYGSARRVSERALSLHCSAFGNDDADTLALMNNLAGTLAQQGDLSGARKLQDQALTVCRRLVGEEHPETLTCMNNLAGTLRTQGDFSGSRALDERVLAGRIRVLGEKHPHTLVTMNNLAGTLSAQGELPAARKLYERSLALLREVCGERHPDTLITMGNLGNTLRSQGEISGARELHEEALAGCRSVLGEAHVDTLTSMNNLGTTLRAEGDVRGARELQEAALAKRRQVLGDEHPATLISMNDLANTLGSLGDLAGARKLQERVLAIRSRVLGRNHPATLTSLTNLAETLGALGDLSGAKEFVEEALAVRRRELGEHHPDTLSSMHILAFVLWQSGKTTDAAALMRKVVDGRASKLGADHPHTKISTTMLARILGNGTSSPP